jgi:hypothetical protein
LRSLPQRYIGRDYDDDDDDDDDGGRRRGRWKGARRRAAAGNRFLYRLGPFKARVCAPLQASFGFSPGVEGYRALEKACYDPAVDPAVGARAKAMAQALMGDAERGRSRLGLEVWEGGGWPRCDGRWPPVCCCGGGGAYAARAAAGGRLLLRDMDLT